MKNTLWYTWVYTVSQMLCQGQTYHVYFEVHHFLVVEQSFWDPSITRSSGVRKLGAVCDGYSST